MTACWQPLNQSLPAGSAAPSLPPRYRPRITDSGIVGCQHITKQLQHVAWIENNVDSVTTLWRNKPRLKGTIYLKTAHATNVSMCQLLGCYRRSSLWLLRKVYTSSFTPAQVIWCQRPQPLHCRALCDGSADFLQLAHISSPSSSDVIDIL